MLVIRRRLGETLIIGEDVEIEILETAGSSVKLGIRAPRNVAVIRKELLLTRRQNRAASRDIPHSALEELLSALKAACSSTISPL